MEVVLGEWQVKWDPDCNLSQCLEKVPRRKVQELYIHERYNQIEVDGYDIAMIRVDDKIPLFPFDSTAIVTPVCLPWSSNDFGHNLRNNDMLTVTGWGTTEENLKTGKDQVTGEYYVKNDILQQVKLPYVDIKTCQEKLFDFKEPSKVICAGGVEGKERG